MEAPPPPSPDDMDTREGQEAFKRRLWEVATDEGGGGGKRIKAGLVALVEAIDLASTMEESSSGSEVSHFDLEDLDKCLPWAKDMKFSCLKGWVIGEPVGRGRSGCVFRLCRQGDQCQVVKLQAPDPKVDPQVEVAWQKRFAALGLAPKIYGRICRGRDLRREGRQFFATRMERVDGTLRSLMKRQPPPTRAELEPFVRRLQDIVKTLDAESTIHGDMHMGNIGFINDPSVEGGRRWVMLDFGQSREYPQGVGTVKPSGWSVEPKAQDLDMLLRHLLDHKFASTQVLRKLILDNIAGFFSNHVVPPNFAKLLESGRYGPSSPGRLGTFTGLGHDHLVEIAIYFSYADILSWIVKARNKALARDLASGVVWSRMVLRDYPYVHRAITATPEARTMAQAFITAMALNRGLTELEHAERFWKRVYEWALRTSRETVALVPRGFPEDDTDVDDDFKAWSWNQDNLILISDFDGRDVPGTMRVRIMDTFTKVVTKDIRLQNVDMDFEHGNLRNGRCYVAPPYVCLRVVEWPGPGEPEVPDTYQVWNVEDGTRLMEFQFQQYVGVFIMFIKPGETTPTICWTVESDEWEDSDHLWKQSLPKGQPVRLLKDFRSKSKFISDHYLCHVYREDEATAAVTIYDLLGNHEDVEFDIDVGVKVKDFHYPYLLTRSTGEDVMFQVFDVSRPGQPVVWHHHIGLDANDDISGFLGQGFVMLALGEHGTFYALPHPPNTVLLRAFPDAPPVPTLIPSVKPPIFLGGPVLSYIGKIGYIEDEPSLGRYFLNHTSVTMTIFGPHADQILGPPVPVPELVPVPQVARKPVVPFLASTRLGVL